MPRDRDRAAVADRNAIRLGADEALILDLQNPQTTIGELRRQTDGRGADVAIEAVGKPETWELGRQLVRHGGTINFFGGCPTGTVNLDTPLLHYSEITCKASFHHTPGHIRRSLDVVATGKVTSDSS